MKEKYPTYKCPKCGCHDIIADVICIVEIHRMKNGSIPYKFIDYDEIVDTHRCTCKSCGNTGFLCHWEVNEKDPDEK